MATEPQDRRRVLVIDPIASDAERRLARAAELVRPEGLEPRHLRAALEGASGAIVRTTPLPRSVLCTAAGLRVIAKHGTGVDGIDLACASEQGIVVARAGGANATAVAEFTLAAILLTLKPIISGSRWLQTTTISGPLVVAAECAGLVARELSSQVVGVVGFGEIGHRVAAAVSALGGSVLVHDPAANAAAPAPPRVKFTGDLPTLLKTADVVTIHVPLTFATRSLIGPAELGLMKRTATLVNTSRGGVIDEAALVSALRRGRLRAAVIDVYDHEPPPPTHPLLGRDDVVCTPHIAGLTAEALERMAAGAVTAVLDVLGGREPADVANRDVLAHLGLAAARG
jgi:D-3-phosphoglycerate dehydrogenase / 2-oxoglutarate reductase